MKNMRTNKENRDAFFIGVFLVVGLGLALLFG